MSIDTIIALAIVAVAAAFIIRRAVRAARAKKAAGPGCDNCGH